MFSSRFVVGLAATAAIVTCLAGPASASSTEIVREYREVPGAGVFTTCADGSDVTFTSLSYRDYTTWFRDGVAVRERRHLTYDGTLTRGSRASATPVSGTATRTSSPASCGSPVASSASTCHPVALWSERACGPRARSSRAPVTASWSTSALRWEPDARTPGGRGRRGRQPHGGCSDGTSSGPVAERATSSFTGSGAILPPPEDPPWTPAPGQPTEVPDKPKIRLPRLEKLPSTSLVVHGAPAALVASPGTLWVQQHRGYELTRVDTEQGEIVASVNVGLLGCGDLTWAAGSVWETGCAITRGLVQVDGDTTEVRDTVYLSGLGSAYLDDEIWMTTLEDGVAELRRIDVAHVDEGRAVPVPGLSADGSVEAAAGSVWVSDTRRMVYQVDPASEEVVAAIPMPVPPDTGELIEHDGAAWYVDPSLGVLVRVDPVDGSTRLLKVRIKRPSEIGALAASTAPGPPGRLWVRSGDKEVWLVDTRHDRVLRRIAVLDGGGGDVQQIGDTLWVAQFITDRVERIPLG